MSEKPDTPVDSPEIPRLPRVLEPGHDYATVTDKISSIVLTRPVSLGWLAGFSVSFAIVMVLLGSIAWLIIKGVGIWGINIPVGWGFAIVNFVWWIGIGHAGTLISAILFLLNQQWRTSINRFAEAMTLFAVACVLHVPLPEHHGHLAAVPQSADLGRVRGFYLRHGFPDLLVCRVAAGPGDPAGSRQEQVATGYFRHV